MKNIEIFDFFTIRIKILSHPKTNYLTEIPLKISILSYVIILLKIDASFGRSTSFDNQCLKE